MFDVGRAVALVWALVAACHARAWGAALVTVAVGYLFALEVASGFTIRDQGPMLPMVSMLLIFIGPSAMPRGPLPSLPLAGAVVAWPAAVNGLACAALAVLAWRASVRVTALPMREENLIQRVSRVALALTLNACFQALLLAIRMLPTLLGGDLGDGRMN